MGRKGIKENMNNGFFKGLIAGLGTAIATVLVFWIIGLNGIKNNDAEGEKLALGTASPTPVVTAAPVTTKEPNENAGVTGTVNDKDGTGAKVTQTPMVTEGVTETASVTFTPTPTVTPIPEADKFTSDSLSDEGFLNKLNLLGTIMAGYYYKDLSESEIIESIYRALLDSIGDPYTCYYSPVEYDDLMESSSGTYYGIGAYVSQNTETKIITVTEPFENGPAYAAGIRAGDVIKMVFDTDVSEMDLTNVVAMMKGEEGTEAVITVYRESTDETLTFTVIRGKVDVPTVSAKLLDGNLGYIKVSEFDEVTEQQFKDAVDGFEKQNVKGLIIDLRNNGGGLLNVTVEMADYILPQADLITYTLDKYGEGTKYFSDDKHKVDLPIAILVNGYSASASEVFTGALKDHGAATVIGTTTFGKGIVQSVLPITDGSAVKITTSSYYTPSGVCIHGVGIEPDITVNYTEDDNQLDAAVEYLLGK